MAVAGKVVRAAVVSPASRSLSEPQILPDWSPGQESEQKWAVIETIFRLPEAERPTAAAVFNDHFAFHLAERLGLLGLSVPGDVALTGFDDIVPALPGGVGLTTVAQPYEEIGRKAAELILRRMADPNAPMVSAGLTAPLIVRESSQYHGQDFPK